MAECPFCSSQITEQLAIHGGTCPSCFGEIPGEEAPTDPGAAVRAVQEAEDAKTVQRSRLPLVAAVIALFGLAGGAAWIATRPPPEVPVLDFDQLEFAEYEITVMDDPDTEAPAAAPTPRPRQPRPSGLDELIASGDPSVGGAGTGNDGSADADPNAGGTRRIEGEDADVDPTRMNIPSVGVGGSSMDGPDLSIRRGNVPSVTLTDDGEIVDMLARTLSENVRGLNVCYTRELRTNDSLRGEWVLEATVMPNGSVTDIRVTGVNMSSAPMESCIATKVEAWPFQRIRAAQGIRKTLRFRPM